MENKNNNKKQNFKYRGLYLSLFTCSKKLKVLVFGLIIGIIPCLIVGYHSIYIHPDDINQSLCEVKMLSITSPISIVIMISSLFIDK